MDTESYEHAELIAYLKEEGHSREMITRILERLREREKTTSTDALIDMWAKGEFQIDGLIADVVQELQPDLSTKSELT